MKHEYVIGLLLIYHHMMIMNIIHILNYYYQVLGKIKNINMCDYIFIYDNIHISYQYKIKRHHITYHDPHHHIIIV